MGEKPASKLSPLDLTGMVLLIVWVMWVVVSSFAHGASFSDALPYLTAPIFAVLGIFAGRRLQANEIPSWFAAFLLALSVYYLISVTAQGGAGGGPLGYANANSALGIQLSAVCAITALQLRGLPRTWALWATGLSAVGVPWTLSQAGVILLIPLSIAILLVFAAPAKRRTWMVPCAVLTISAAAGLVVTFARMSQWPKAFKRAFTSARQQLWTDALELWARKPLAGSGPGSFARFSGLAQDPDTNRVHMSVLQVGSELGCIGVLLFAGLVLIAFTRLARAAPGAGFVGSAALSAILIHSFVDHLIEFPAITLATGMVIGLAVRIRSG